MSTTLDRLPLSGTHILFLDVDHHGATADGERFDAEPKVYRDHSRVEDVVIRFPDGLLKLAQRITPAR